MSFTASHDSGLPGEGRTGANDIRNDPRSITVRIVYAQRITVRFQCAEYALPERPYSGNASTQNHILIDRLLNVRELNCAHSARSISR